MSIIPIRSGKEDDDSSKADGDEVARQRKLENQRRRRIVSALTSFSGAKITEEEVQAAFIALDNQRKKVEVDTVYNHLRPHEGVKLFKRDALAKNAVDMDLLKRTPISLPTTPHKDYLFVPNQNGGDSRISCTNAQRLKIRFCLWL